MKKENNYREDIAEIRSMMERSSKFLSLSGWAGIMAGIFALTGAFAAYSFLDFRPNGLFLNPTDRSTLYLQETILLAVAVLVLALTAAIFVSYKKSQKRNEKLWNPTARLLLINISIPLMAGGILILLMISKGLIGLAAPLSLIFYGLALFNASKYTYKEVKVLGLVQLSLGLISSSLIEYGLLFWAFGFGVVHIIYGIHMNLKYER